MNDKKKYQVLARKYRPQSFAEVLGQEATVTTLKNAIRSGHLAHAYLFSGSRGTGKTTLARILAKALNCSEATGEPCNQCSSCKEITAGNSLDVLEIDGASHRGIEDIRQINDTVGYASSSGKYKIYIIDEVHMLTKEAFNALLKTLEEPPPNVIFFFATTEPHKVLPTIVSRCQRFQLNRIPLETIVTKLKQITEDLEIKAEIEALRIVAKRADGGLRDAESLLDQILSFHEGELTEDVVSQVLGLMPRDVLFQLDEAGKKGEFAKAFDIAAQVFTEGKDFIHFVECLVEHFRTILLVKLTGEASLSDERYVKSAELYSKEQCLNLLEYLVEAQNKIRFMPSARVALETILLHIMRCHTRLPVEFLVKQLHELEAKLGAAPAEKPKPAPIATPKPASIEKPKKVVKASVTEDPTPSNQDLGIEKPLPSFSRKEQSKYDTLLQFAAVELEGKVQRRS